MVSALKRRFWDNREKKILKVENEKMVRQINYIKQ